jgi:hypothetical protein
LAYFPALWPQEEIEEHVHFVNSDGSFESFFSPPSKTFEPVHQRTSYDAKPLAIQDKTRPARLGDIVLARSGDKGPNLNFGLFVHTKQEWEWLSRYFSRAKVTELLGEEMESSYTVERVEFPSMFTVHFVVYGILGRGVSSSKRLDGFGKGFADYFRDKVINIPVSILDAKIH